MRYLRDELKWHFRIRVKSNAWIERPAKGWKQLNQYPLVGGEVVLLQAVKLTKTHAFGSLNLAMGRNPIGRQVWFVATDEPASLLTFQEYGRRCQIAAELLDEKSNGFQLECSEIRSAIALSRLCFVLAVATLLLTVQGQQVVTAGKRRWVDAHWQRGNSYLRIGWNWVKGGLHQEWRLFPSLSLRGQADPHPAVASKKQTQKQLEREFTVKSFSYAS